MSDDSPLFVSAIELIAHSTELYTQGNERKYKFVILHLANAIELILKDRLVDKGASIYIPKKSLTITIWDSFERLGEIGVTVPERPVIELLVDDRNTIQHRFGFPDSETVYYYLKRVVAFFKRFLDEEYGVDLSDTLKPYLATEDLAILGLVEEEEDRYAQLDRLFELSPESAILQAYNALESKFLELMGIDLDSQRRPFMFWRAADFPHLLDDLAIAGFISQDTARKFNLLREMRNRAAHTAHFEGEPFLGWAEALSIAKDLLQGLDQAIEEDFFRKRATRKGLSESDNFGNETIPQNAAEEEIDSRSLTSTSEATA